MELVFKHWALGFQSLLLPVPPRVTRDCPLFVEVSTEVNKLKSPPVTPVTSFPPGEQCFLKEQRK
jgi:hypothetical protein